MEKLSSVRWPNWRVEKGVAVCGGLCGRSGGRERVGPKSVCERRPERFACAGEVAGDVGVAVVSAAAAHGSSGLPLGNKRPILKGDRKCPGASLPTDRGPALCISSMTVSDKGQRLTVASPERFGEHIDAVRRAEANFDINRCVACSDLCCFLHEAHHVHACGKSPILCMNTCVERALKADTDRCLAAQVASYGMESLLLRNAGRRSTAACAERRHVSACSPSPPGMQSKGEMKPVKKGAHMQREKVDLKNSLRVERKNIGGRKN
ncbi:hypothetical protein EYF80_029990 [Liparis tanakae]|uniref:Uncharacterized protein n=1 Tax=Liparis tanakae TaxID=230148 RepID=A0A4Z2H3C6_9TELE|nr:hypothetical protein EYF80_029990 [Liparis tanakae]